MPISFLSSVFIFFGKLPHCGIAGSYYTSSQVALVVRNAPTDGGDRQGFYPWVGKIPCRSAWQPTPGSLPGESHGQRSLVGYSPWGLKESDRTEATYHEQAIRTRGSCITQYFMMGLWARITGSCLERARPVVLHLWLSIRITWGAFKSTEPGFSLIEKWYGP